MVDQSREDLDDGQTYFDDDSTPILPVNVGSGATPLRPPSDKKNFVFVTFAILGISALAPWTFFTTPTSYWMYKFRDANETDGHDPHDKTDMQKSFLSYLSLVGTTTCTVCLIINALFCHRIHINYRLMGSFAWLIILFILTTCLVDVNTDNAQGLFFLATLVTVGLMNGVTAVLMGGFAGISGKFPHAYITSFNIGQALSGLTAATARIITLLMGASDEGSAFVYFLFADCVLISGAIMYAVASKTDFFLHYQHLGLHEDEDSDEDVVPLRSVKSLVVQKNVLAKMWEEAVSALLILAVTLCIIPSLMSLAVSESNVDDSLWSNGLFIPLCGFFVYNFGDLAGRIVSGWIHWPSPESRGLTLTLSLMRIGLIPLFMGCNLHPRDYLPVFLESDYYFVFISLTLGLTNGYMQNTVSMNAPRKVGPKDQETVGLIMAAFYGIGTCIGSLLAVAAVHFL